MDYGQLFNVIGSALGFGIAAFLGTLFFAGLPTKASLGAALSAFVAAFWSHLRQSPLRVLALVVLAASLAGCGALLTRDLGYGGAHPGYISCKGKGAITGSGTTSLGAGISGAGMNAFTIQADCGDGFTFSQGPGLVGGNTSVPATLATPATNR